MRKLVLAIDPGPAKSAIVVYDGTRPTDGRILHNDDVREIVEGGGDYHDLAIEGIACYGMAVGKETFDTCIWIGRFIEAFGGGNYTLIYRPDIKLHLCKSARAKDANVRQALIDKFGGSDAIGLKKTPGPLYNIKSHCWAALAVAVTYCETRDEVAK